MRRRADSTRARATLPRQDRGLLERLERDPHEGGAACARPHHDTLQIDDVHYRPGAGVIVAIAQVPSRVLPLPILTRLCEGLGQTVLVIGGQYGKYAVRAGARVGRAGGSNL